MVRLLHRSGAISLPRQLRCRLDRRRLRKLLLPRRVAAWTRDTTKLPACLVWPISSVFFCCPSSYLPSTHAASLPHKSRPCPAAVFGPGRFFFLLVSIFSLSLSISLFAFSREPGKKGQKRGDPGGNISFPGADYLALEPLDETLSHQPSKTILAPAQVRSCLGAVSVPT